MKKRNRYIALGSLAAVAALGTGGYAVAAGGDDHDGGKERALSGQVKDEAIAAATAAYPGNANSTEYDSENGATYEVEVAGDNGKTVDVRLDESFKVVVVEGDSERG